MGSARDSLERHLATLRVCVDRQERAAEYAAALRARYAEVPGRVVVEHDGPVEVDEAKILCAIRRAKKTHAREIALIIDGLGGLTASMWRIVDALRSFPGRKIGVVVGRAPSASAIIFAACDTRIAAPSATFLIHSSGFRSDTWPPSRYTAADLDAAAARLSRSDIRASELLLRQTGSRHVVDLHQDGADHELTAAEAAEFGLVQRIEPEIEQAESPPSSLFGHFRPRAAEARAKLAGVLRQQGRAGDAFLAVRIEGQIGPRRRASVSVLQKALRAAPYARTLRVHVDSIGGDIEEAARMYAALMEHPAVKKEAIIRGSCLSAGLIPVMACNVRRAGPNARFLLHPAEIAPGSHGDRRWTTAQHREAVRQLEKADAELLELCARATGISVPTLAAAMRRGCELSAIDALQLGLVHQVEGITRPPQRKWLEAVGRASGVIGMPSYLFSENFLAACRAS